MANLKEVAEMDKTKVESRKKERYEKLIVVIYGTLQNQKQLIKRNLPIGVQLPLQIGVGGMDLLWRMPICAE